MTESEEELIKLKEKGDEIVVGIKNGTATVEDVGIFLDILMRLKAAADARSSYEDISRVMFLIGYAQCYIDFKVKEGAE